MAVILRYAGKDCSLQFWRFHRKDQLLTHGPALRVGRIVESMEIERHCNRVVRPKIYGNSTFNYDNNW